MNKIQYLPFSTIGIILGKSLKFQVEKQHLSFLTAVEKKLPLLGGSNVVEEKFSV